MGCGGCGAERAKQIAESLANSKKVLPPKFDGRENARSRKARLEGREVPRPAPPDEVFKQVHIAFPHGLGDSALMALTVPIYLLHGWQITVDPTPYSRVLWQRAGANIRSGGTPHKFPHAPSGQNKFRFNLGRPPLPPLPSVDLWNEVQTIQLGLEDEVTQAGRGVVDYWVKRKMIAFNGNGHTLQDAKDLPPELQAEVVRLLLDADYDVVMVGSEVPFSDPRVQRWDTSFLPNLWYLLDSVDGVIAIDSGVLHLASHWCDVATVGVWTGHRPESFALPSSTVHIAREGGRNGEYSVKEYSGKLPSANLIVQTALSVIA